MRARLAPTTRAAFHAADGVLLVVREPPPSMPAPGQPAAVPGDPREGVEILLALWDDGSATALHGHVDLGTGIRTALGQIVAEELDLTMDRVCVVLGDTARAPNQGATIASASIQIHAAPLRAAAAQAMQWLAANDRAGHDRDAPAIDTAALAAALRHRHIELTLDLDTPVKPAAEHRIVGESTPRVDIPAKATGELVFVHDMRVPGMLHGRVVRPPYAGADHGDFIGNTLDAVDEASIADIPGLRAVVVQRDFVGVVAEREEDAERAARELVVRWKPWPGLPDVSDLAQAISANPSTRRELVNEGDVDKAMANAAMAMPRTYVWPYQLHASIGPSCALADWRGDTMTVWAGTQNPHVLRADLATLMACEPAAIEVVRMEAAGCYGRNGADDVAADALLLSRAVKAPVRVQLTREQENAWEPKGAAQLMQVRGGLNDDGSPAAYDFETSYPSNGAPTLALLLTRTVPPMARSFEMGDRTARPPYSYANLRVAVNDMPPILRASWLRGVSALPSSFAHESYIDELASAAGVDPVAYRLRYLNDERAAELVRATAAKAGWQHRPRGGGVAQATPPAPQPAIGSSTMTRDDNVAPTSAEDWQHGQGFAYARYIHSRWPGFGAAWSAWVADVDVNRVTGEVQVTRVVVGHDAGALINPAGVTHQVHGNILQTTSRALLEQLDVAPSRGVARGSSGAAPLTPIAMPDAAGIRSLEWGSYPILRFGQVPVIDVLHMSRQDEPSLGAGESASVPGTAAIANAIFDAIGVRLREPPFTPERVRAALHAAATSAHTATLGGGGSLTAMPSAAWPSASASASASAPAPAPATQASATPLASATTLVAASDAPWPRRRGFWRRALALAGAGLSLAGAAVTWRTAIAPVGRIDPAIYTADTIERGRRLAAAGDCAVCHTAPQGVRNAGGRAMKTPFGTVYSTNLTPDAATGIGAWSFSAFQRAMREGVSRDGHHLYPVFPYTAFAKTSDDDLMALYAYLMAQPPVAAATPPADLRLPFGWRPLMAGWNALFHDPSTYRPQAQRSAEWNRGAYLVEGVGHCGACHTPRNAFGAEQAGAMHLSGAFADGWEAPALGASSRAALPWSQDEFYRYLRTGRTDHHGTTGGPMGPVVRELQALPDDDIRAMATYLASFTLAKPSPAPASRVADANALPGPTQRLFEGACGACHHDGHGPQVFGTNLPLSQNSNLTSDHPDNLLRTILDGVRDPPTGQLGFMPAFRNAMSDSQIADIAAYMRQHFAPQRPAWTDLRSRVAALRAQQ